MGRLLIAENSSLIRNILTRLSSASSVSATIISVDNMSDFSANDFIVIGEEGTETAELKKIESVTSPGTITITSALKFEHLVDSPIRVALIDQIKFYGSTSTTISASNILATVDVMVDNPRKETMYNHSEGTDSWYYKFTYYNSVTGDESSLDDAILISGGTATDLYCTEDDVLDYLNISKDDTEAPSSSALLRLIESRCNQINSDTNTSFRVETIESTDKKYIDGRGLNNMWYFLGHSPIISITSLETTQTEPGTTATWTTLTSGRDNDFILDKVRGMAYICSSSNYPKNYPDSLRWYGTWGRESVPDDVRDIIVKGVIFDLSKLTIYKNLIKGHTFEIQNSTLNEFGKDWDKIVKNYLVRTFINV